MARSRPQHWPVVTAIAAAVCLVIALPDDMKAWAPAFMRPQLHLGLDLAGGTQLDFRISEEEINRRKEEIRAAVADLERTGANASMIAEKQNELRSIEQQHANIVEAIRTVLERRINALGVSEATITPSYYGSERHLLVDCPGVIDARECMETVGKTIQLEFKEEFTEATEEYRAQVTERAESAFATIQAGERTLKTLGEDMSATLGVSFVDSADYFRDELPDGLEDVWNMRVGDPVVKIDGAIRQTYFNEQGQPETIEIPGIFLVEVLENPRMESRTLADPLEAMKELHRTTTGAELTEQYGIDPASLPAHRAQAILSAQLGVPSPYAEENKNGVLYVLDRVSGTEEIAVSHLLVSYAGALRAEPSVSRSRDEAQQRAQSLLSRLQGGADFATLAREESDGPSAEGGGSLGTIRRGDMVPPFEEAAFLLNEGQLSGVVETDFGFHVIRADSARRTIGAEASYALLLTEGDALPLVSALEEGTVERMEEQMTLRVLFFSLQPTGWKDTELTGQYFRAASVTVDNLTNTPVVQIQFDERGGQIFQELTRRNIDKQIAIFVGGDLVSAPVVQQEISGGIAVITGSASLEEARLLAQDLNTGAIPAPIYLSGQRTIEATLGADALQRSLYAGIIGIVLLMAFMILVYRMLGVIASVALLFYLVIFIAMLKLPVLLVTDQYIVLTLAGIAGLILSLGMAVDANILIFERMKEELQKGKTLKTAAETGFKRAWPSIRDGNASTLITCLVLFVIGTSIVRGFAITLSLGILLSLFTAIVVTRWLLGKVVSSPLSERPLLFGLKERKSTLKT